jgi:hypothetical protein
MEKKNIITMIIVFLVIALAIFLIFNKRVEYVNEVDAKLIGNNSILFIQAGCSHCMEQEEIFGENIKYLNIVDCFKDEDMHRCINEGIEATPTWLINGKKYVGFRTLRELKTIFINDG